MSSIEGGSSALQVWRPSIVNLVAQASFGANPLRIRTLVDRMGVGVIHVELHAVGHGMAQEELARVIVAVADGAPGIQGGKLGGEVLWHGIRLRHAAEGYAPGEARVAVDAVNDLLEGGFVVHVTARHQVKHVLGRGRICWGAPCTASRSRRASRRGSE